MPAIQYRIVQHRGESRIVVLFSPNADWNKRIKTVEGARWSATLKGWTIPDTAVNRQQCGLPANPVSTPVSPTATPVNTKMPPLSANNQMQLQLFIQQLQLKAYSPSTIIFELWAILNQILKAMKYYHFRTLIVALSVSIWCCDSYGQLSKSTLKDFPEIDAYLQSLIDTGNIPGIAIAVTNREDIIYSKAFGVTNLQTKEKLQPWHSFHVASISKTFTATAIMQLVDKGKIDINKTLITYLPYFKLNDERYTLITIKEMLNHTSGMPDVDDYEWEKAFTDEGAAERYTRSLVDKKMISDPGKEFHYSNMAYDVLADLIVKVSGMSYEKYMKINFLIPLEMPESSFYFPEIKQSLRTSPHTGTPPVVSAVYPYNRMHAASGTLNTNVLELSNWAIANLNGGNYKGKQILSASTHAFMWTPTFRAFDMDNLKIGLCWIILQENGITSYIHLGHDLGYEASLELLPEQKTGIIIFINYDAVDMHIIQSKVKEILLTKYANALLQ